MTQKKSLSNFLARLEVGMDISYQFIDRNNLEVWMQFEPIQRCIQLLGNNCYSKEKLQIKTNLKFSMPTSHKELFTPAILIISLREKTGKGNFSRLFLSHRMEYARSKKNYCLVSLSQLNGLGTLIKKSAMVFVRRY